jgi:pantoate kinase
LKFSSDPGCKFIAEFLADPDLDKAIAGSADFASNLGESADLYTPIYSPSLFRGDFKIGTLPGRKITIQLLVN